MVSLPRGAAPHVICSRLDRSYLCVRGSLTRRTTMGGTRKSLVIRKFWMYERNDENSKAGTTIQVFPRYSSAWRT